MEDVTPELDVERGFHHQGVESVCNASPPPSSASTERCRKWDRGPIECCKNWGLLYRNSCFHTEFQPCHFLFCSVSRWAKYWINWLSRMQFPVRLSASVQATLSDTCKPSCLEKINGGGCFSAAAAAHRLQTVTLWDSGNQVSELYKKGVFGVFLKKSSQPRWMNKTLELIVKIIV